MVATRTGNINASYNDMPIGIITTMTIFANSGATTIVVIAQTTPCPGACQSRRSQPLLVESRWPGALSLATRAGARRRTAVA